MTRYEIITTTRVGPTILNRARTREGAELIFEYELSLDSTKIVEVNEDGKLILICTGDHYLDLIEETNE